MSKKSPLPQTRRHVMIYDEDWDFLFAEFGPGSKLAVQVGLSGAIKTIIHAKVLDMKAKANDAFDQIRDEIRAASQNNQPSGTRTDDRT